MSDRRKKRIRAIADELGISHRAAANVLEVRKRCPHEKATPTVSGLLKCDNCGQVHAVPFGLRSTSATKEMK